MKRLLTGLCAIVLVAAGAPRAQQPAAPGRSGPQPGVTFKVQVDYVEVDVVVTDPQGRFVNTLKKEDFQVFEDGKPQNVSIFTPVDLIIERPVQPLFAATPIEPDVKTNDREFDGRVYVIVLDDLHTSLLRTARVKTAAKRFIERYVGANDLVAVIHTSGRADAGQEFTNSRRLLLAAVDKFMPRKLRSSVAERIDEYNRQRSIQPPPSGDSGGSRDPIRDPLDFERGYFARMTLETLQHVADAVAGVRGRRKAVLFISEGIDYNITNPFEFRDATTIIDETRQTLSAATRGNVSFYSIDPRGLATGTEEEIDSVAAYPEDPTLGLTQSELRNEMQRSQDSLRTLAEETGGFAAVNRNDYTDAFDRLVRENSTYYLLGYYPTNDRRDGRFRKIEVKIAGRPDLKVRARKGYVSERRKGRPRVTEGADENIPAVLRDLQDSPVPVGGLRLSVTAAPFKWAPSTGAGAAGKPGSRAPAAPKDPPPTASVVVTVHADGRDLQFPEKGGTHIGKLDVSVMALDRDAKIRGGDRPTVDMTLRPQTYEAIIRDGLATVSKIDLAAGRYQLRIAARESGTGRTGSVHYDLEVPDFAGQPISMSGLALTSSRAARTMTVDTSKQVKTFLPLLPSVRREFGTDEVVGVFAEIYDNVTRPHGIDISTTLRADDGTTAFTAREERHTKELQGSRGGFGTVVEVPLAGVKPGLYILRVEARSRLDNTTVTREAPIRIVAGSPPPGNR
jgi:VWFA-related protein